MNLKLNLFRKAVPCPVIDIIDHDNFRYLTGSDFAVGGFSPDLVFNWDPVSKREQIRRGQDNSLPI